jgi:hypothetical protein
MEARELALKISHENRTPCINMVFLISVNDHFTSSFFAKTRHTFGTGNCKLGDLLALKPRAKTSVHCGRKNIHAWLIQAATG